MKAVIYGSPGMGGLPFIAEGLEKCGYAVIWREDRDAYKPNYVERQFDLAVTDGVRASMSLMLEEYNAAGLPVIVTDMGFLKRFDGYMQLGLNGLNWLPPMSCSSDRFTKLGIELKDKKENRSGHVLITGQKPYDGQHHMSPQQLETMYNMWVTNIRKHTDRFIVFRPHPRCPDMQIDANYTDVPTDTRNGGLVEVMASAFCVVTYNSTSATDALIEGVPVFCHKSAQAAKLGNGLNFEAIEQPFFPSREKREDHFNRVAYAQWTVQEMVSGQATQFVMGTIQ